LLQTNLPSLECDATANSYANERIAMARVKDREMKTDVAKQRSNRASTLGVGSFSTAFLPSYPQQQAEATTQQEISPVPLNHM
jgi:hypothetical protein